MAIGEPYIDNFGRKITPAPVTVAAAKDFITRIVPENVLPEVAEMPHWGSHLHRVLARIALNEKPTEEFDIARLYVEERIRDNPHIDRIGPESQAIRYLSGRKYSSVKELDIAFDGLFPLGQPEI